MRAINNNPMAFHIIKKNWHFGSSMTLQPKSPSFLTLFYLTQIFYSNLITLSRREKAFIQDG
jgi:hypothetical protein